MNLDQLRLTQLLQKSEPAIQAEVTLTYNNDKYKLIWQPASHPIFTEAKSHVQIFKNGTWIGSGYNERELSFEQAIDLIKNYGH